MPNPEVSVIISAKDALSPLLAQLENKTKASTDRMGGQWQKLAAVITSAFATEKIISFASKGIKELDDFTTMSARLQAQLGSGAKGLIEYAEAEQRVTRYSHDEIMASQSLLASHKLNSEQIKKLIPVIEDYAAKSGRSLTETAMAFSYAIQYGTGRALRPYGIELNKTGSQQSIFNDLVKLGEGNVKGLAQKMGDIGSGPLIRAQIQLDEIAEVLAKGLLPSLNNLAKWFIAHESTIEKFAVGIGNAFGFIIDHSLEIAVIALAGTAIPRLTTAIQTFGVKSLLALGPILTAITAIDMGVNLLIANMEKKAEKRGNWFGNPETVKQVALLQKEFKNLDNDASMAAEKRQKEIDKQLQSLTGFKAAELPDFRAALLLKPKVEPGETPDTSKLGIDPFGKVKTDSAHKLAVDRYKKQTEDIAKFEKDLQLVFFKGSQAEYKIAKTKYDKQEADLKKFEDEQNKISAKGAEARKKIAEDEARRKKELQDYTMMESFKAAEMAIQATKDVSKALHASAQEQAFVAGSMAVVRGAEAVMGVLAATAPIPPPAGPILAGIEIAAIVAETAVQIAKISGAKFAFGGVVPGTPSKGDYVPALLTPGERVLTRRQQENISNTNSYHIDNSVVVQGNIDSRAVKDFNRSRQRQARDLINLMRYTKMTGANLGTFA